MFHLVGLNCSAKQARFEVCSMHIPGSGCVKFAVAGTTVDVIERRGV